MALPKEEMFSRVERFRNLLREKGLSCGLVYYDELNIANGWYLTGWCPQFESGCVLVPVEGEPLVLGGPESEPFARTDSAITKTRNIPVFMVPEEEYPNAYISSFAEVFSELGLGQVKEIGVVGLEKMPYGVFMLLNKEIEGISLVDITGEYEAFRRVKSPWEVDCIRRGFDLAGKAFVEMEKALGEGMTETSIAAAGERKARELGANSFAFQTIVASGERTAAVVPTATPDKVLKRGETVMLGISPRVNGYAGVGGFGYVVGDKMSESQRRAFNDLTEAYNITRSNLGPGKVGKNIDQPTRKFLLEKGYEQYLVCPFAHTIGLMEAEAPFFGPGSDDILQPGMTVCVDVSAFGIPGVGGVRFETGFLITEEGFEPLHPLFDKKIMECSF